MSENQPSRYQRHGLALFTATLIGLFVLVTIIQVAC
jgi:hypothetical protein